MVILFCVLRWFGFRIQLRFRYGLKAPEFKVQRRFEMMPVTQAAAC